MGTDDTPTSGTWSPTNTAGTNLVKVSESQYDGGGVGDSRLTAATRYPGHGRAARTTAAAYDWRGRPVAVKDGVEASESEAVNRPLALFEYDNLGQTLSTAVYDGDTVAVTATPALTRRRAVTAASYDELGRVYRTDAYGVDQTTGAGAVTPLTAQAWFDPRGQVIKAQSADGRVAKSQYDGLGRVTTSSLTDGGGDSGYADADDVTGDVVWAQAEAAYDAAGQLLQTTARSRVYGETGTGPLGTPTTGVKARVSYAGWYFDLAGRVTDAVDVGTNGGSSWTRPGSVPSRSDTTLVTSVSYGADGRPQDVTDPRGLVARTAHDRLGRVTSSTAVYGTADAFTVTAAYDSAGRLLDVTAPGSRTTRTGYDSWGRATSVTERYGTAYARTSTVALDDTGGALTATDPLGTVTAFTEDILGRTTSVTAASGTGLARTASATYDALGRTLTATDPRGYVTTSAYDDPTRAVTVTDAAGYAWTTAFDQAGRVSTAADPFGNTTTVGYDLPGRVVSVTDPLSHATTFQHTVNAAEDRTLDALGNVTKRVYDRFGRIESAVNALGYATLFGYDRNGNTVSVEDASGNLTSYTFDNLDRLLTETDPLGKAASYVYNSSGTLASVTDRLGRVREFGYDAGDRVTSEVWKASGGATVPTQTFGYDLLDRMTSATDPDGNYTLTYDALGQTKTVAGPWGVDLTFGYDAGGNRTSVTDNKGGSTASTFDALGRLSTRTQTQSGMGTVRADWAYTKAGEVASVTRFTDAAGTVKAGATGYSYDNARRLVGIDHTNATATSVGAYTFGYDNADRLTSETFNGTGRTYGYDAAGQLTNDNGTSYAYDKTGNRTGGGYVTGADNRTTSDGTWSYTYDDAGQMTGKSKSGEAWAYTYDHLGQMTAASKSATPGGTVTDAVSYKIDAWGDRIERAQTGTTSSTQRYVVDGWDTAKPGAIGTENFDTVVDLDGSNAVTNRRMFGGEFDSAVARQDAGGGVTWYGQDQVGSVRQVFDNSGNATGSQTTSAFGQVTATSGTGQDRYGYTGTVTDPLTGLVGDNARQYDPQLGKWTSRDPIGFAAGDPNLYRAVGNQVTMATDPSGLQTPGGSTTPITDNGQVAIRPVANNDTSGQQSPKNNKDPWHFDPLEFLQGVKQMTHQQIDDFARKGGNQFMDLGPVKQIADKWIDDNRQPLALTGAFVHGSLALIHDQFFKEDTNPDSVGAPGFWDGLIPFYGSGRASINAFQNGRYGSGVVNAGLAIMDVFLVKSLVQGGIKAAGGLTVREAVATSAEGTVKAGGREAVEQSATKTVRGWSAKGGTAPPPTGPASEELRNLMIRNAESRWFRTKVNFWSWLTGRGSFDWAGFMAKLKSAEFLEFATALEARSLGWAGPSSTKPGQWLFGVPSWSRKIPVYGNGTIQHELFHAVQDYKYGLFAMDEATMPLLRKYGQVELAAVTFGNPSLGIPFIYVPAGGAVLTLGGVVYLAIK